MRASWVVSLCEKETRGKVPLSYHFTAVACSLSLGAGSLWRQSSSMQCQSCVSSVCERVGQAQLVPKRRA